MAILARSARDNGLDALGKGDRQAAVQWLDRAHRLVPSDLPITLSLASVCLGHDNRRAVALFRAILKNVDVREAWVGLCAGCFALGDDVGAVDAMENALRRHAVTVGLEGFADRAARRGRYPGWCGMLGSGVLVVHARDDADVRVAIDAQPVVRNDIRVDWAMARRMTVTAKEKHLLGSPLDLLSIGRTAGYAELGDGCIQGWAAHPSDPETEPLLAVLDRDGSVLRRIVCTTDIVGTGDRTGLLAARGFRLPVAALPELDGPIRVIGRDGVELMGSPLYPGLLERIIAQRTGRRVRVDAASHSESLPPVAVVIPVCQPLAPNLACVDRLLSRIDADSRIIVVADGPSTAGVMVDLDRWQAAGRVEVIHHDRAMGWSACVTTGISACVGCDVVLVSHRTLVPPGWLDRLAKAAYARPDIGTVTPLSNGAGYARYPVPAALGDSLDDAQTQQIDRLARRAKQVEPVDIPIGPDLCLYIKRRCLIEVGGFDGEIFAHGSGAESDFCLRASLHGWRHVALPTLFVGVNGNAGQDSAAECLRIRNDNILGRLHPGYAESAQSFLIRDPLAAARRRLDIAYWRGAQPPGQNSAILITHSDGGGVEQRVSAASAAYRVAGLRPIVLRPAVMPDGGDGVAIGDGTDGGFANLRFALPDEMPALLRFLRGTHPSVLEVHHLLGHSVAIHDLARRLDVPYDVHVHDYAMVCPRISLLDGNNRYCGEPELEGCDACIVRNGTLSGEQIGVGPLRRRSAQILAKARRVIAPSIDTATRFRRYFPKQPIDVIPHEIDPAYPKPTGTRGIVKICVLGGIGPHKGYDLLLACARDAATRALGLAFVVVGDTIGDLDLLATGHATITGTYKPEEAVALARAQHAALGFVPSVWPETWCLTLSELWHAGLAVVAFDLGAQAERIRVSRRGEVLPLGLTPSGINNALLAAATRFGHE